jgi:hypothetical protein
MSAASVALTVVKIATVAPGLADRRQLAVVAGD